jgi:hypothetical protein
VICFVVILLASVDRAGACFVIEGNPYSWVRQADVIIRARAVNAVEPESLSLLERHYEKVVSFEILEVLKGGPFFSFSVRGVITEQSDFNDGPVAYNITRRGNGSCFARSYQLGGEYLFLREEVEGKLTPYWASLAATNEQLRGAEDPWLL